MAPQFPLLPTLPARPLKPPTPVHTPPHPRVPRGHPTPSPQFLQSPPPRPLFLPSSPPWLPRQQATRRPRHLGPLSTAREPHPQGPTRPPPRLDTNRGHHPPSEQGPHPAFEAPLRQQVQGPSSQVRPPWGRGPCPLRGPPVCRLCLRPPRPQPRGRPWRPRRSNRSRPKSMRPPRVRCPRPEALRPLPRWWTCPATPASRPGEQPWGWGRVGLGADAEGATGALRSRSPCPVRIGGHELGERGRGGARSGAKSSTALRPARQVQQAPGPRLQLVRAQRPVLRAAGGLQTGQEARRPGGESAARGRAARARGEGARARAGSARRSASARKSASWSAVW